MFSLPSLPTDNLYKFIFIGGLVCLISSFFLTDKVVYNQIEDIKTLGSLRIVNIAKNSLVKEEISQIRDFLKTDSVEDIEIKKELKQFEKDGYKDEKLKVSLIERLTKSRTDALRKKSVIDSLIKDGVQNDKDIDMVEADLKAKRSKRERNESSSELLGLFGLLTLTIGGILWFINTQRVQDELLSLSLKMARIAYNEKLKSISPENGTSEQVQETIIAQSSQESD